MRNLSKRSFLTSAWHDNWVFFFATEPAYVYWAYPECRADLCVCDSLAVQCITEANEFHEEYKAENFVRGLDCDYKKY